MRFPLQPIQKDTHGVLRFVPNRIVKTLLNSGPWDLNKLAELDIFTPEEWEQFAQLIGYSVSGWGDLSYVCGDAIKDAEQASKAVQ
jgi:hypothetical protein